MKTRTGAIPETPDKKSALCVHNNSFEWLTWTLHLKLDFYGSDDL